MYKSYSSINYIGPISIKCVCTCMHVCNDYINLSILISIPESDSTLGNNPKLNHSIPWFLIESPLSNLDEQLV